MKSKFYRINGFVFGHLLKSWFWWLHWMAIKSIITGGSYTAGDRNTLIFMQVGSFDPLPMFWENGWTVSICAYIFGKPVLLYEIRQTKRLEHLARLKEWYLKSKTNENHFTQGQPDRAEP